MKKNRVFTTIATALIGASMVTTACFTGSALTKIETSASKPSESYVESESNSKAKEIYTNMENPFIKCNTLEEAARIAGVKVNLPEYSRCEIYAVKDIFVEVQYEQNESGKITIRKNMTDEDFTGIDSDRVITVHTDNDIEVNIKLKDGFLVGAYFTGEDGTYSITCEEALSVNEVLEIVNNIVKANNN